MNDTDVDFNIVVSIPTTQNIGRGSKQVTQYLLVIEATSTSSGKTWQWKKVRRYSQFYGLYQQLKKKYPNELKSVTFPPKKVFGRLNSSVIKERRSLLEEFLGAVVENLEIINSDVHLRAFLEIDKTLSPIVMQEKNIKNEHVFSEQENDKTKYAKALYTFEARNEEELSIMAGEYFVVSSTLDNNGWWEGQLRGEVGFFPRNYVQLVDEIPEEYEDLLLANDSSPELPNPIIPSEMNASTKMNRRNTLLSRLDSPQLPTASPSEVIPHVVGTALYSFQGENEFELNFKKGDTVIVYTIDQNTGWWQGKSGDSVGYFPGSYVVLPAGAEDLLMTLIEEDASKETSPRIVNEIPEKIEQINEEPTPKTTTEGTFDELKDKPLPKPPSKSGADQAKNVEVEKISNANTLAKRNSITLRGNSFSRRPLPKPPAKTDIQKVKLQDSAFSGRKCILCPCESWVPSEFEKNFCVNCRHLARMHRVLSVKIPNGPQN